MLIPEMVSVVRVCESELTRVSAAALVNGLQAIPFKDLSIVLLKDVL